MNQRKIFMFSIPVFIAHGIEEYLTDFTSVDSIFVWAFQPVMNLSVGQASFVVFQIMFWLLLGFSALLLLGEQWQRRLLIIPGIIYILEAHHFIEAIVRMSYYPGLITAIAFPILAFFFWREYWFPSNSK